MEKYTHPLCQMELIEDKVPGKVQIGIYGTYLSMVLNILVSGVFGIVLVGAANDIGGMEIYALATSLNTAVLCGCIPVFGKIAMMADRKKMLVIGAIGYAALIIACAFCPTMISIIGVALLLGVFGAMMTSVGYTVVGDVVGEKLRAPWLSIFTMIMNIGNLGFPLICGFLLDYATWRICFIVLSIFPLVGGLLAWSCLPNYKKIEIEKMKLDVGGAIFLMIALAGLILTLSLGFSFAPFGSKIGNILLGVTIVAFIILFVIEKGQGDNAVFPTVVLKNRNALLIFLQSITGHSATLALAAFLALYMTTVMQTTASQASLSVTVSGILGIFVSPIFGRYCGKKGTTAQVIILCSVVNIVFCLLFIYTVGPKVPIMLIYVIRFFTSLPGVSCNLGVNVGMQMLVPEEIRAQAAAAGGLSAQLGVALSVAIFTGVLAGFGVEKGFMICMWITVLFSALTILLTLPIKNSNDL